MGRLAALMVAMVMACARPVLAQPAAEAASRAEAHLTTALGYFRDKKYDAAIEELRAAQLISPQARFVFALGQAYRLNHQCAQAVNAYRDFLHYEPPKQQAAAAEQGIRQCEGELPAVEQPASSAPAVLDQPVLTATTAPPIEPTPTRRPLYKRWWLWTTVGVVAVGAGLGIGLGVGLTRHAHFTSSVPAIGPGPGGAP